MTIALGRPSFGEGSVVFVAVLAIGVLAAAFASGDATALTFVSAAIVEPLLLFGAVQCALWRRGYAQVAIVALVVLLCATFRIREITDKTVDLQILLRLGSLAGLAIMALVAAGQGMLTLRGPVLTIWGLFAAYSVFTSLYSLTPSTAFIETMSGLIGFLFLLSVRRKLGADGLTQSLIWSAWILCLLSIATYIGNPSVGRMFDWVNGAYVPTSRLTGVFGTPNAAGASAAAGFLLTVLLSGWSWRRPSFLIAIGPMLICLVLSNNRMAMFAVLLALLYAYVAKGSHHLKILGLLLVAGLVALAFVLDGDAILESLSRSGSSEEITSGTGRTRIWAVVLDLWSQQPIFGYGEGSARLILPVHPLLFKAAAHAHSLYLNALFSGGVIGFGLLFAGLWSSVKAAISQRNHELIALLVFQLFYGLTEPTIGELISFPSISFFAVMVLIGAAGSDNARRRVATPAFWPRRGQLGLET